VIISMANLVMVHQVENKIMMQGLIKTLRFRYGGLLES
jgi:hypothetical protein